MIGQGAERLRAQRHRRVQLIRPVQVEFHWAYPSVDAAHAVDGDLLDEQFVGLDEVLEVLVFQDHGVLGHVKTFLLNGAVAFLAKLKCLPARR